MNKIVLISTLFFHFVFSANALIIPSIPLPTGYDSSYECVIKKTVWNRNCPDTGGFLPVYRMMKSETAEIERITKCFGDPNKDREIRVSKYLNLILHSTYGNDMCFINRSDKIGRDENIETVIDDTYKTIKELISKAYNKEIQVQFVSEWKDKGICGGGKQKLSKRGCYLQFIFENGAYLNTDYTSRILIDTIIESDVNTADMIIDFQLPVFNIELDSYIPVKSQNEILDDIRNQRVLLDLAGTLDTVEVSGVKYSYSNKSCLGGEFEKYLIPTLVLRLNLYSKGRKITMEYSHDAIQNKYLEFSEEYLKLFKSPVEKPEYSELIYNTWLNRTMKHWHQNRKNELNPKYYIIHQYLKDNFDAVRADNIDVKKLLKDLMEIAVTEWKFSVIQFARSSAEPFTGACFVFIDPVKKLWNLGVVVFRRMIGEAGSESYYIDFKEILLKK